MNLEQEHIVKIRKMFAAMRTKTDLLNIMNYAKPILYGRNSIPFELKQLTWHANTVINPSRYESFTVEKKSGGQRIIHAPEPGLRAIQKVLNLVFQSVFQPHKAATGFTKEKSVVHNALVHAGSNYVFNIDLEDFFLSIDQARVWACFQLKPINLRILREEEMAVDEKLCEDSGFFFTDQDEKGYYTVTSAGQVTLHKSRGDYAR